MKVLQICNKAPYPANDGSSIAIYNMAMGLVENGVDLHLLTINTKKHYKADGQVPAEFKTRTNYLSVFRNTNTGLTGAFLNLFSTSSYFVSRFYFKGFEKKLTEILTQKQFDIVQVEGLFMGVYIDFIKKKSRAKIVLRAHNVEHFIWNRHILHEKHYLRRLYLLLQNKRLKKFELNIVAKVDAIVTITGADEQAFKQLGFVNKRIFTCITGVDVAEYQQYHTKTEKARTVFYFGSMDWLPNQEAVIWFLENCWHKVHQAVPDVKLIIAGRGMPLEFFHITKPNVFIVENVENAKQFYQQHQVMIVPLWSGSGLRIKIIEGMAYGKAIVSTSIGAEGINCTNNENIIIANQPQAFADAVITLLTVDEKRKELEKNAAAFAARTFNNSNVVQQLIRFYKQWPDE